MQSKKKTILAVAALVVIAAVLLLVWRAVTPKGEAGEKTITVQVLHKGGEERVFTLETGEAYLGAVLTAEGVVEDQGPYGLYMLTVDLLRPWTRAARWWKLTRRAEKWSTGQADWHPPLPDWRHLIECPVGYDGLSTSEPHGGAGAGAPGPVGRAAAGDQAGPGWLLISSRFLCLS